MAKLLAEVKLTGVQQAVWDMGRLEGKLQNNILRGSVAKVAASIRDDARVGVPKKTGKLKKNITSRRRRGKRHETKASVIVNEEGSRGDPKQAFYWRFVEFGHFDRGGGWIPGVHYLKKAYDGMRGRVDDVMASYIRGRFERVMKK